MARSSINRPTIQATTDNGSVLQSFVQGEQVRTQLTFRFFTNLHGAQIAARVVEANNVGLTYRNGVPTAYPTELRTGAVIQSLPIRYQYRAGTGTDGAVTLSDYRMHLPTGGTDIPDPPLGSNQTSVIHDTDGLYTIDFVGDYVSNSVEVVWDADLADGFTTQPRIDRPVYAFFGVEIRDAGDPAIEAQQIWKPVRGLVEFKYSVNPLF